MRLRGRVALAEQKERESRAELAAREALSPQVTVVYELPVDKAAYISTLEKKLAHADEQIKDQQASYENQLLSLSLRIDDLLENEVCWF